jgi:drug/metabolite transporter (DMT)-like permease
VLGPGRAGLTRRGARRPGGTIAALLALYVCWGASVPAMKLMVKTAPPLGSAGAVFLLGGVVLGLCSTKRRRPTLAQGRRAALAGTIMLVAGQGLVTVLLTKLTVSLVSVLITTVPLWFVVLARLRGTKVSCGSYVRLMAGFSGVALVVITAPKAAIGGSPWAVVGCCIAPVLWAAGSLLASRRDAMPDDPHVTAAIQMTAGGLTLLLLAAAFGQLSPTAWAGVTADSLAAGAFLLTIDSLAGFMLYTRLLRSAPPQLVSTYAYATPLVSIAIGTTILGQPLWLGAVAGAIVVITTVALEIRTHGRD